MKAIRECSICERKNTNVYARHQVTQICIDCYRDGWRIRPDGAIARVDDYDRGGYFHHTVFVPFQGKGEGIRLNGRFYNVYFEDELTNMVHDHYLILRRHWRTNHEHRH
jgi:hypothetical protein